MIERPAAAAEQSRAGTGAWPARARSSRLAEPVDQEHDDPRGRQPQAGAGGRRVDAQRAQRRGHDGRPATRRRTPGRPGSASGAAVTAPVARDKAAAKPRTAARTASAPSAASLTRSAMSSARRGAGVAVVGLAVGVGAGGRLEVEAADRAPADRER